MTLSEKLDALLAECEKATPEPWIQHGDDDLGQIEIRGGKDDYSVAAFCIAEEGDGTGCDPETDRANADFTIRARTSYPKALRAFKELAADMETLSRCLADEKWKNFAGEAYERASKEFGNV